MKYKPPFLFSWKFFALILILFVLSVWVFVNAVSETAKQMDESGGLKAVVERVWEGKK